MSGGPLLLYAVTTARGRPLAVVAACDADAAIAAVSRRRYKDPQRRDRARPIGRAMLGASPGDVVLLCPWAYAAKHRMDPGAEYAVGGGAPVLGTAHERTSQEVRDAVRAVFRVAAAACGLDLADVERSRLADHAPARHACYLALRRTGLPFERMARAYQRHHTTVLYSVRRGEQIEDVARRSGRAANAEVRLFSVAYSASVGELARRGFMPTPPSPPAMLS